MTDKTIGQAQFVIRKTNTILPFRIKVFRDNHGKFSISVNGVAAQKRLNATETVKYLLATLDRC